MPAAPSARASTYDSPPTPDTYTESEPEDLPVWIPESEPESEPEDLPALVENLDSLTMGWYLQSLQPPSLRPPLPTPTQPTPAQLSRQHAITLAQLSRQQANHPCMLCNNSINTEAGNITSCGQPCGIGRACRNATGTLEGTCIHAKGHDPAVAHMCAPCDDYTSSEEDDAHLPSAAQLSRQQAITAITQSVPSQSTTAEPELLPPMHMLMASGGVAQYEINTFGVELPGPDGTSVTLEELDAFGQHLLPPPLTNHHNIDTTNNITTQRFHQIIHLPLHFRGVRAEYNYFTSNSPPPPTYYQPLTNTPPPPVVYDWMHSLLPHHQHQNSSSSTDTYAQPEVPPPPFDTPPASPRHHHYQQYIWEDDDLGMRMTWTQLDESEGE